MKTDKNLTPVKCAVYSHTELMKMSVNDDGTKLIGTCVCDAPRNRHKNRKVYKTDLAPTKPAKLNLPTSAKE